MSDQQLVLYLRIFAQLRLSQKLVIHPGKNNNNVNEADSLVRQKDNILRMRIESLKKSGVHYNRIGENQGERNKIRSNFWLF